MVPLLDPPSSSILQSTELDAECSPTTSSVSSVHYHLGRRGNCYSTSSTSGSGSKDKSSYYRVSKNSTMGTNLVTMAVAILVSCLFLNVVLVDANGDILSSSSPSSTNNNNKFSFHNNHNHSNSVFSGNGGTQASYSHRFKGLDRILNRLDGRGGSHGVEAPTTGNNADSGFPNTKDHFQPSHHFQPQRRFLSGGSNNEMSVASSLAVSAGTGKSSTSSGSHQQNRSPSSSFPSLSSLTAIGGGGFKTPGKTYFDAGEDEDLDEDTDDDDSYEEEDDNHDEELLNDKMSNWAHNYKSRYLAQRKSPPTTSSTTTTTTTTTTPTPPTTTSTTTTTPPPPTSYSHWKWQNLGTRQGLEHYRRQISNGGGSSSSSINSNSIYSSPSLSNGNGGTGSSSSSYPYHHRQTGHHNTGSNRYFGSSTNSHSSPYSPYSSGSSTRSSHSSPSSSQGNPWQGGSNRAQPQTPGAAISEAVRHALKVRKEASCNVPQPRVVRVQDFYPHPGKTYVPHCTILHQCSDDTGCCRHDTLTCSPKTTQRVELAFYTISLDQSRAPMVDRLVFYNHTECECRDKLDEMMPRDQQHNPSAPSSPTLSPSSSSLLSMTSSQYLDPYSFSSGGISANRKNAIIDSNTIDDGTQQGECKCPSVFNERILSDGSCSCDCFDKEKKCLHLKRGRDFFTLADKWCIQSGRCEVPECAYGPYIHLIGRCPRKREQSGQTTSWTRYLTTS